MEAIVSIISLMVIATVTIVLLYQNARVKDSVALSMQNVVDQINDATYYDHEFNQKQEDNIKNLDTNMQTISKDLSNLSSAINAVKMQTPTNTEISKTVNTQNVRTKILSIGDKFSLSTIANNVDNEEWLALNDIGDRKLHGGMMLNKISVKNGASLEGKTATDDLKVNKRFEVTGGVSEHNPQKLNTIFRESDGRNYVRGDTEIRGNVSSFGDIKVSRNLSVGNSISVNNSAQGPIFQNTTQKGTAFGIGNYKGDEMRFYNTNADGTIRFGYGKESEFAPVMEVNRSALRFGSGDGQFTFASATEKGKWSPASALNDTVMRTEKDKQSLIFQNGATGNGMILNENRLGVGTMPQYGKLDVAGDIAARGNQLLLGAGGDTGGSRALVKGNGGELILNHSNDFSQGVTSHSDIALLGSRCVETGKGVVGKEANAGKICYGKFSNSLDIVGAGGTGSKGETTERVVKVWDNLETGNLNASKLCLGSVCIDQSDLARIKKEDGHMCLGNSCLVEEDINSIKTMKNKIKTQRIEVGDKWSLQPEANDQYFTLRDNSTGQDTRYAFTGNTYKNL